MIIYLLLIGFFSILGQVTILRELNVAFYGVELIYILAIGVWLFGSALGAILGRKSYVPSVRTIAVISMITGVCLIADIAFVRGTRVLFAGIPGGYLPFPLQLLAVILILLPVSGLLGLLFQWVAKRYVEAERTLAQAYAIESAGGLLGGLASTFLLITHVQNFPIALICSLITFAGSVYYGIRFRIRSIWIPAAVLSLGCALLLGNARQIDRAMSAWNHPNLTVSRDTPYSRITLTERAGQVSVYENDVLTFESEGTETEEFVHLSLLHHQNPGDVLILGGGFKGIVTETLQHNPRRVTYVEMDQQLISLAKKFMPQDIAGSLTTERVHLVYDDPRRYLERDVKYDVVLVAMPEPSSGQTNRFYTREFFQACAGVLNPQGMVAFAIPSAENLWSPQLRQRNLSIFRAVEAVFPEIRILPGASNIVVGLHSSTGPDPDILADRWKRRDIRSRRVSPQYIHYLYTNDRYSEITDLLESTHAAINTDVQPICYQYTLMIWLSQFYPGLAHLEFAGLSSLSGQFWMLLGGVTLFGVGALLLLRRMILTRRMLLVGLAGFLGMVMETIIILNYQVHSGALYRDIGLLLMSFMAGLAIGSYVTHRYSLDVSTHSARFRLAGVFLLITVGLMNFGFLLILRSGVGGSLVPGILAVVFAGFFVGTMFAYAGLRGVGDQKGVVSPLYFADLLGGCIGSVAASLFLIPLLGMQQSVLILLGIVALMFVLV
ncbi:MAG TPA: hypothetical protein VKA68_18855 [bacterium]|nr:hypothetical protein [bacterium]